jgi:radical SAM superfamily enzyme YgiQ (UPF0313 family)
VQIELLAPATEDSTYLPRLGLGILAALTPASDEVIYTDEVIRRFDLEHDVKDVDLVGITADSKTARRAYEIAHAYRRRGVKVVLGGIHPTALPDEAAHFADAVVVGEAEDLWPQLVADFKRGGLKPRYAGHWPELGGRPLARRDLFASKKYVPFKVVQTMRGCPYLCEFCSVSTANGTTMRFRPVEEVLAELKTLGRLILFADDNVMVHRKYSAELFTRMAELNKSWIGQCSLSAIRNVENVELLAKSGCKALFVGFESVDDATLKHMGKHQNRTKDYREVVARLHEHGIATWGAFVFGFDTDNLESFDRTAEFAIDAQLTIASFAILTPYPATKLYRRLAAEGRLTEPRWWLRGNHDADSPYFIPKLMTREQLHEGWQRAWKKFYEPSAIWQRYRPRHTAGWIQNFAHLPLNLMQNRLVKQKIIGGKQRFRTGSLNPSAAAFDQCLKELPGPEESPSELACLTL